MKGKPLNFTPKGTRPGKTSNLAPSSNESSLLKKQVLGMANGFTHQSSFKLQQNAPFILTSSTSPTKHENKEYEV